MEWRRFVTYLWNDPRISHADENKWTICISALFNFRAIFCWCACPHERGLKYNISISDNHRIHVRYRETSLQRCIYNRRNNIRLGPVVIRTLQHVWDPEIWAQSVFADAWRPALAGYSTASAVQARCDSPSLSSAPSSRLPRWSSWSPASAICQTSSTVSSTSSTRHLWYPCFFCSGTNSLEFTARLSEGSSCRLRTV